MKIYLFGNEDVSADRAAFTVAEKLAGKIPGAEFVIVKPNADLPFEGQSEVTIMDAAQGISEVAILDENDVDKLTVTKSVTVHDFDLGFQLKLLRKLGKLKKITIIGIPREQTPDYDRIQSILRKLVEQDIQGS